MPDWHLYIIQCADTSLYTGITTDTERRFKQHQNNKGAKRLKGRGPLQMVFQARVGEKSLALRLEHAVKKLDRQSKIDLILGKRHIEDLLPHTTSGSEAK